MSPSPPSGPRLSPPPFGLSSTRRIVVPDACVGVKWYVPEVDSSEAARLLDPQIELHVPAWFYVEAASVFQRKVAVDRTLSEAEGFDAFQLLRTVPMIVHTTEALLEDALRHGMRYRRPVYDGLYLVLAEAVSGRMMTGDRRLYNGVHAGPLDHLVMWVTDPL